MHILKKFLIKKINLKNIWNIIKKNSVLKTSFMSKIRLRHSFLIGKKIMSLMSL